MNPKNLQKNGNEQTDTLEMEEQIQTSSLEGKKNKQEFAKETLGKIEKDIEALPKNGEDIGKIETSLTLNNPTIKNEIKSELGLSDKLNFLDGEIKNIISETKSNINEIVREDDSVTRDFSKNYHHPEYRKQVAGEILEARKSGQDAEAVKQGFYEKTAKEKENFESQEKERSVAEIMKEKDLVIVHAIPLSTLERKSTTENNPILKTGGHQGFKTSVEILSGLSPTISTSIPSPERKGNGLYYPSGVILSEGKILSAQPRDSGSVAHSLYKRISKDLGNQTAIQSKINIDEIIGKSEHYNELTVENPKIAGLFYDISELPPVTKPDLKFLEGLSKEENEDRNKELEKKYFKQQENRQDEEEKRLRVEKYRLYQMKNFSKEINVPLYVFKNESGELKKYKVEFLPREEEDYFENIIVPKANELLTKAGGDKNDLEYKKFIEGDYDNAKRAINKIEKEDYILKEVTAEDIYKSKKDIYQTRKEKK